MVECGVYELTKYYGANKIFENISFTINTGDRIGLIGQNGSGKTTLMKILMGLEDYQGGMVSIRKGAQVGYLEQIHQVKESTVQEVLEQAFEKTIRLKKVLEGIEKELPFLKGEALEEAMTQYGQSMEEYELVDGYQVETKINRVCQGLGILESMRNMNFEDLSGGEKTRVILGKLLLESPDILLLDEPSNHLDISSTEWLESFLKEYKGTVIVISHDRYFLDSVATKIYELEPKEMVVYYGNYSAYVVEKERRFLEDFRRYQNQQKQIVRMQEQIHRYRVWGAMRDSEVMYKRAKELEKRLEKINELERPVLEHRRMGMQPLVESRSGKRVVSVEEIEKSYDDKRLISRGSFTIFYQDSICLMGQNGSGKTTLLKLILGEITPDKGTIRLGAEVKIGYLPQQVVFEDEEKTVLEYFSYRHGITLGEARGALAKMLFMQENANKKIKSLSGGEKSRLKLCSLTYEKINFLILDEPTNHLDIESREVLEESLMSFEGTILFVSHDRYFVEKIADKILHLEEGKLQLYPFGYQSFIKDRQKQMEMSNSISPASKEKGKVYNSKLKTENSISTSATKIEEAIEQLEAKRKEVVSNMEKNGWNLSLLDSLMLEKEELEKSIEAFYQQWEQLVMMQEKNES
ncbi:MAG: ribosomal protection-like ABC-F family protein [Thermotaleaceae bacterium]